MDPYVQTTNLSKKLLIIIISVIVVIFALLILIFVIKPPFVDQLLTKLNPPRPGFCLILEEKYCKLASIIKNPNDKNVLFAAFTLPKEAILFAPANGIYSNTPTFFFKEKWTDRIFKYPGSAVIVSQDGHSQTVSMIFSFLYFKEGSNTHPADIKQGEIIAKVSDKNIGYLGPYNLVMGITNQTIASQSGKAQFENASDQLKSLFKITP